MKSNWKMKLKMKQTKKILLDSFSPFSDVFCAWEIRNNYSFIGIDAQ
jgi:hypothetical protein